MAMAQDAMSKKVSSLLEKKDAANEDLIAIGKKAEGTNSKMSQSKTTLASKVKATIKKVGKILRKAKPRKKRIMLYPIVAATLKFHKDDDVDPADAGCACRS